MKCEQRYLDPYFNDIPWEIYYDESGRIVGEVYALLPNLSKGSFGHDREKRR